MEITLNLEEGGTKALKGFFDKDVRNLNFLTECPQENKSVYFGSSTSLDKDLVTTHFNLKKTTKIEAADYIIIPYKEVKANDEYYVFEAKDNATGEVFYYEHSRIIPEHLSSDYTFKIFNVYSENAYNYIKLVIDNQNKVYTNFQITCLMNGDLSEDNFKLIENLIGSGEKNNIKIGLNLLLTHDVSNFIIRLHINSNKSSNWRDALATRGHHVNWFLKKHNISPRVFKSKKALIPIMETTTCKEDLQGGINYIKPEIFHEIVYRVKVINALYNYYGKVLGLKKENFLKDFCNGHFFGEQDSSSDNVNE